MWILIIKYLCSVLLDLLIKEEKILNYYYLYQINRKWKEGNVLFNDALNTFYLLLYGVRHTVKNHSNSERETPLLLYVRLAARVLLCAPSQRLDSTYHNLCCTSCEALARTRNAQWVHKVRLPIAP